jgi:hypothetical protein
MVRSKYKPAAMMSKPMMLMRMALIQTAFVSGG